MGLLDVYDTQIGNPDPITGAYLLYNDWDMIDYDKFRLWKNICWIVEDTQENRKLFKNQTLAANIFHSSKTGFPYNPFTFNIYKIKFLYNTTTQTLDWEILSRNNASLFSTIGYVNTYYLYQKIRGALNGQIRYTITDISDIIQLENIIEGLNCKLLNAGFKFLDKI